MAGVSQVLCLNMTNMTDVAVCFQVWVEEDQRSRRSLICPFNNTGRWSFWSSSHYTAGSYTLVCWCFLRVHSRGPSKECMAECVNERCPGSAEWPPVSTVVERVCPLQAGRGSVALLPTEGLPGATGIQTAAEKWLMETKQQGTVGKTYWVCLLSY